MTQVYLVDCSSVIIYVTQVCV